MRVRKFEILSERFGFCFEVAAAFMIIIIIIMKFTKINLNCDIVINNSVEEK